MKKDIIEHVFTKIHDYAGEVLEMDDMFISLVSMDEIHEIQLGYSIDDNGNSLVGKGEGDWKEGWLVIGQEDCGDPIFIDILQEGYPVYTAMHGEGEWNPILLFENLDEMLTQF